MKQELNKERIESLRKGDVILENDDIRKCREIISYAFKDSGEFTGASKYYVMALYLKRRWTGVITEKEMTELTKIHPTAWFYEPEPAIAPKEIDWTTIPVGAPFKCKIKGVESEGKIQKEDEKIFLCQNIVEGGVCKDKLGYKYSWIFGHFSQINVTDLELFPEPQGKFIGYVCPENYYGGFIEKGTIYVKKNELDNGYHPFHDPFTTTFYLPAEIVEQWQKAFEQVPKEIEYMMPFMNGDKVPVAVNSFSLFIPGVGYIAITELQNIIDKAKTLQP